MWSPDKPVSDENQIPDLQNVPCKSVGRTPLKPLTDQQLAVLHPNTLVKKRSSLPKPSSHSALKIKESTRVRAISPVNVWIEPCRTIPLTESSETEANTSKKRPYCLLLAAEVSEGDGPASPEICDPYIQSIGIAVKAQPEDSSGNQTASRVNKGDPTPSVNDIAHGLHLKDDKLILPSTITMKELPQLQIGPALEDHTYQKGTLMSDEPESHDDACGDLIPGSPLKPVTQPNKITLENVYSEDENSIAAIDLNPNASVISKPEISILSVRNDSRLDDLLFSNEALEEVQEANTVMSENITYEIDPLLNAVSEQSFGTILDVLSEVTEKIVNCNSFLKDNEAADNESNVNRPSQVETLSSSAPDTVINELKETRISSGSPEELDPTLCGNWERSLPDTLPIEHSLLSEVVYDPEMSLLCNTLFNMKTNANKSCTHVDGVTTDPILTAGDLTPLTHTHWFSPISHLDPIWKPNPGQGNVTEDTPFTESSQTPIGPNPSKFSKIPLHKKAMCKHFSPRMLVSPQEAGTSMTPALTTDGVTWTTPIMLLNRSMNTSSDSIGKEEKSAKDNSSETDPVLWNFSREVLSNASRDELMDRLESTLIVIEVLSRQLQEWQNIVPAKPCEQRECATQTGITYTSTHSHKEESAEFVQRVQYVSSEEEEDRTRMQRQCSRAKELMSRYKYLFEVMKEKTRSALEEYDGIKIERDITVIENEKIYSHLETMKSQMEQMKLENSRLGSELELLMGRLCAVEYEREQLKEENYELEELLSAKDMSVKLLEKELNETTARAHDYQDHIKQLVGQVMPSLEMDLSTTLKQKQALEKQLKMLAKEHASQIAYYTESLEFLEQENIACREQVAETESELKAHHLTVLERNFRCEELKDILKELQMEVSDLQEKLSHSREEARSRITKLSKEILDSSTEISKIKSHVLEVTENLREDTKAEAMENLPGSQTPCRSLIPLTDEVTTANISSADLEDQREGIWSKTSAFTVVHPVTSPSADTPQEYLLDVVCELSNVVADVVSASSYALDKKQQAIQDFKMEISYLNREVRNLRSTHTSEVRVLQGEVDNLKRRNCVLDHKINCKEKCISELQEVVNQQEHKILHQFSKSKDSEVLLQENAELQSILKVCEKEVEVLKQELAQNSTDAARNWLQEKLLLHKDLTTLRMKLIDTEYSKSEAIQRLLRHKDIMGANLASSDAEVQKLDNILERVRQDLLSIPEVVNGCEKLRQLMDYLS